MPTLCDGRTMQVVIVKASRPDEQDRTYLIREGRSDRAPVHALHDLPHLVVESLFGLGDGLWGELAQGMHFEAEAAASARDPKRQKLGRIVSGAASGSRTGTWLSDGHRLAKAATNAVTNRWGDGPDTPAGARQRISAAEGERARVLLDRLDDETIALAIWGVRELDARWAVTPPGDALELHWPLPRSFFDAGVSR